MTRVAPSVAFVEDSDTDFEMAERAVRRIAPEAQVLRGESLQDAINALTVENLALIVVDIHLRGASGIEILAGLRASGLPEGVGIVVFSTSSNPLDKSAAMAAGADGYHQKPALPLDYLKLVEELVLPWIVGR